MGFRQDFQSYLNELPTMVAALESPGRDRDNEATFAVAFLFGAYKLFFPRQRLRAVTRASSRHSAGLPAITRKAR